MKCSNLLSILFLAIFASCSTYETVEEQEELFESTSFLEMNSSEALLFDIINEHRISIGLNALQFDSAAYQVAQRHNAYMINANRISHEHFSDRASELNKKANAISVGENVARSFPTEKGVLQAWLNSPTHKATIESDYTHTGISITINPNGEPYFTQMFFSKM
ncbi:CAP domain-containing protein [Croceivirga thetidis]|uniref:CAP domain-containing protein n=1 Tax=Croceivirga thetidis TaxID=2721623 RepID=A0ABX1GR46_9FLAO|nr:CAP domain-containing protein [Croceivirga thetidis]NKI31410.1 CAP domain-containing protein [Croceivirga thetidis]